MTQGDAATQRGSCFCGGVQFTLKGSPVGMGYCHCESCRQWSASPVNAFTLWQPDAMTITKGEGLLRTYSKTPKSLRSWCDSCGGHIFARHPGMGLLDVYAAAMPGFAFEAGVHVNYAETRLPMRDGLPKLKDLPREMGGTGDTVPE